MSPKTSLGLLIAITLIVMTAAKFGDRMDGKSASTPLPTPAGLTATTAAKPTTSRTARASTSTQRIATTASPVDESQEQKITAAASEGYHSTSPGPNYGPPPEFNFPADFGFGDFGSNFNDGPPPTAASNNEYHHSNYDSGPSGPPEPRAPSGHAHAYNDQGPPPPQSPHFPQPGPAAYGGSGSGTPPAFMQSLMEQFDRALQEERSRKSSSSSSPNPTHSSSSTNIPKSPYDEAARASMPSSIPAPNERSYNNHPTTPSHRSSSQGPPRSPYYGASTAASDGSNVPNYGPSSGSPNYDHPTNSYNNNRIPQSSTYNDRSGYSDRDRPTSNYAGANYNRNDIPQPQGSGTHYNHHGPSGPPPPPGPSGPPHYTSQGPHQQHNNNDHSRHDHARHEHGRQDRGHQDHGRQEQGPSHNDHHSTHHDNYRHGAPTWPQDLPDPTKDNRAKMEEERVGGENREGKPWGHKKKYVYRDPKNGNNYMEISEVHMSMNKEYKPDEAASNIQRMYERNHQFKIQPPSSPFSFDSSEMNPFVPPRSPF